MYYIAKTFPANKFISFASVPRKTRNFLFASILEVTLGTIQRKKLSRPLLCVCAILFYTYCIISVPFVPNISRFFPIKLCIHKESQFASPITGPTQRDFFPKTLIDCKGVPADCAFEAKCTFCMSDKAVK